jgi:acyl dehydratase
LCRKNTAPRWQFESNPATAIQPREMLRLPIGPVTIPSDSTYGRTGNAILKECTMPTDRYWEDFTVGQAFGSGTVTLTAQQIKDFASEFDPQPFHTDETAAAGSFFQGLVASGWHTAAVTMRLLVQSELRVAGGLIGAGLDEVKWPRSVRPGDTLRVVPEVLEVRSLKSHPERGLVRVRVQTFNQEDQLVQTLTANLFVPRRPA